MIPEINSDESDESELKNEPPPIEGGDLKRKCIFSKYPTELLNRMQQQNIKVTVTSIEKGAYSTWVEPQNVEKFLETAKSLYSKKAKSKLFIVK